MFLKTLTLLLLSLPIIAKEATVEQLFNVTTLKVQLQESAKMQKNYGYVKVNESNIYDISPRFGGYVEQLFGDTIYKKVKRGEPLAIVYSPEVLKAKDEYRNTLRYAKKRANTAMLKSAKAKLQLLGVSKREIQNIQKGKYSHNTVIYSPINGYIFKKNINKGSAFRAKQKLFTIVNLDDVWVEVKLFQEQLASLENIQKYAVNFKGLSHTYTTKKALVYPNLDPKIATMTLRLDLKNKEHKIFPGMYANVTSFEKSVKRLTLPTTAVIRKNAKYYVFGVGEYEGEYEPIEVEVKVIDAHTYEILSGLNEGDEVVNNALFMMDSDAQINGLY